MLRKNILLQTIENGFDARVQNYPIILSHTKEREAINYQIYGNTIQSLTPTIDSPVVPQALGTNVGDNYFKVFTTSEIGEQKNINFFISRDLYKVGKSVDYVDYKTQKAYFNTKIYNLIELINAYNLEIYNKQPDVIYASIHYDGKPEDGCFSPIWEFNDGSDLNKESMGIDILNSKLFFSFSWARLGLSYKNGVVYKTKEAETNYLSDKEIIDIISSFLLTLPQDNLNIIGTNKNMEVESIFMPPLSLYKGENKISLIISDTETTPYKYLVTEAGEIVTSKSEEILLIAPTSENAQTIVADEVEGETVISCLITEYGEFLITEEGDVLALENNNDGAPPSAIIIDYKSFMLL